MTEVFVHEIKLTGNSEFIQKFNQVSDLFAAYLEPGITDEEEKSRFKEYFDAKLALEQGL